MFAFSSVLLLMVVSLCYGQSTKEKCAPDAIDFATKVDKSSIVVYGKAMSKIMYEGSDSVFHVFYQVDCVLKGPATLRQINITYAGHLEGKKYCQELPAGSGYSIAFLEPNAVNKTDHKTFTPADFVEILNEGNSISELLARTCNLRRLVPRQSLASVAEVCPAVGTDPSCLQAANSTVIMTMNVLINSTNIILSDAPANVSNKTILMTDNKGILAQPIHTPEQEIETIRGKSGTISIDADKHNGVKSTTYSILLMIMAIFFCSN